MGKIVITGSCGFIGTTLRRYLQKPFEEFDLAIGKDHKDLRRFTGTLIHLSAWVRENESFVDPGKYIDNNLRDLSLILTNNSFDRIIFPSSSAVYDKDGNLNPDSVYGLTKLAGENLIKIYSKNHWILRIANPYGWHDKKSVLHALDTCQRSRGVFDIYINNGVMKDFFPVRHIADVINRILTGDVPPGTYTVGSGKGIHVSTLLTNICKKSGIKHRFIESPPGLSAGFISTHNLLKSEDEDVEKEWLRFLS